MRTLSSPPDLPPANIINLRRRNRPSPMEDDDGRLSDEAAKDFISSVRNQIRSVISKEMRRISDLELFLEREIRALKKERRKTREANKELLILLEKERRQLHRRRKAVSERSPPPPRLLPPPPPPPRRGKVSSIVLMVVDYGEEPLNKRTHLYKIDILNSNSNSNTPPPILVPFARFDTCDGTTMVCYNNSIFAIGGTWVDFKSYNKYPNLHNKDICCMDLSYPNSLCWNQLPQQMALPRYYPKVLVLQSKFYVFGGVLSPSGKTFFKFDDHDWAEVFDPITGIWESLPIPLYAILGKPADRSFSVAAFSSHEIFISIEGCSKAYIFNTTNNSLRDLESSSTSPFFRYQVQIRNKLYTVDCLLGIAEAFDMSTCQFFSNVVKNPFGKPIPEPIFTRAEFPEDLRGFDRFFLPQLHYDPFSIVLNDEDETDEVHILFKSSKHNYPYTELVCRRLDVACKGDGELSVVPVSSTVYRIPETAHFLDAFCLVEN